ncbi:hypothetical protein IT399_01785 [Candidatus Nomurabacteria bacterium]|nr:hypothetical protein [Candidatus Nomurabacteria bacterium]
MKEMSLQLKTRMQNVNIMNNNIEVERVILNSLLSLLAILAIGYVLILGNTVFDIVQRKTLEKEAVALANEVSDLELSYLSLSGSIDMALSSSMGFKETKATFATRKSLGSLRLAKNEI